MHLSVVYLLEASREVLKASGDSSHVTVVSGIGLVQMWHQQASHSLPPPLSLPVILCLSLLLFPSVLLCFFFSFAFPQHPPSQRWRVSVLLRRPGPNVHTERTPIPRSAAYSLGVSSHLCPPLLLLPFSSPPTPPPCAGVWELGPWGWRESRTCFAGELCGISYALPRHPLTGWISPFLSACTPEDNIGWKSAVMMQGKLSVHSFS